MNTKREELLQLLAKKSYEKREVTLASGRKSNFYFDAKQATLDPQGALLTGQLFYEAILKDFPATEAVGGLTMGADPIAVAISVVSAEREKKLPSFLIRKEPKKHGKSLWVEGNKNLYEGMPVVIVEDVGTTGGSALKAVERAEEMGLKVIGVMVLVDRQEGWSESIQQAGHVPHSIFYRADFENGS